jgi:hypothetical protein
VIGAVIAFVTYTATDNAAADQVLREAREGHLDSARSGRATIDAAVASADDALMDLRVAATSLAGDAAAVQQRLIGINLAQADNGLRYRLLGSTDGDTFQGVAFVGSGTGAGNFEVTESTATFNSGGPQPYTFPGVDVSDQEWFQLANTVPDVMHHTGPVDGFVAKQSYVTSTSGPGSSVVWAGFLDTESLAQLVDTSFGAAPRSVTGISHTEGLDTTATGPVADMLNSVPAERSGMSMTAADGTTWFVSSGKIFDNNDTPLWVFATQAPDPGAEHVGVSPWVFAAVALAAGAGTCATATLLAPLRRRTATADDPSMAASPVTEIARLGDALDAAWDHARARLSRSKQREGRLEKLYMHAVAGHREQHQVLADRIHDGPMQVLLAAALTTDDTHPELAEQLRGARGELADVVGELHAKVLSPAELAEQLRSTVESVTSRTAAIDVHIDTDGLDTKLDSRVLIGLTATLLRDTARSGADQVSYRFSHGDDITIDVTDNRLHDHDGDDTGELDPALLPAELVARQHHGTLHVTDGNGRHVRVTLPLA